MLITKKSKFNKFTKKILKGGSNYSDDIISKMKKEMLKKYNFFNVVSVSKLLYDTKLLQECINEMVIQKFDTFTKSKDNIEIILNNYHGSITVPNNKDIVPDKTILCFFTLLGNIGANFDLQSIFENITLDNINKIIKSLQNLNNIQNSYNEHNELLYNNCFKNATFYYPGQKYININLSQSDEKSYNYKITFSNNTIDKIDKGKKDMILLSEYIKSNNTDKKSIYFFTCCRCFNNSNEDEISNLFKYETYIRYINTELIRKYNKSNDLYANDKLLCVSNNKNKVEFIKNGITGSIINTNIKQDYTYHQYGDRMIEIYNEFIIGNFTNILFFSYLSINKQLFILNKIISFNNIKITKRVFNYIIQNIVNKKYYNTLLLNGFTSIIKNNYKLKDNKYTNIVLDNELNHLYYIYSKDIKNYLDLFWRIDHLLEKENKEKLNTIISNFRDKIIQNNYLIYHNVSYIYKDIFNNITEILITNKTTSYELMIFNRYLLECISSNSFRIKKVAFYKIDIGINNFIINDIINNIRNFKINIYFYSFCLEKIDLKNIEWVYFTDININNINITVNNDCNIFFDKININNLTITGYNSNNLSLNILKDCIINNNINIDNIKDLDLSIEGTTFSSSSVIEIKNCLIDSLRMVNIEIVPTINIDETSKLNDFILTNIKSISYKITCIKLILKDYTIQKFTSSSITYNTFSIENNTPLPICIPQLTKGGLNKQPSRENIQDCVEYSFDFLN